MGNLELKLGDGAVLSLVKECWGQGDATKKNQTMYTCPVTYANGQAMHFDRPWPEFRAMLRGDQWRWFPNMPAHLPRPVKNILRAEALRFATRTTAQRPRIGVFPREPGDMALAETYTALMDKVQDDMGWDSIMFALMWEVFTCGIAWMKVEHDEDATTDIKERVSLVLADDVVVEPGISSVDFKQRQATWLIQRYTAQLGWLKDRFPSAKWENYVDHDTIGDEDYVEDVWEEENPAKAATVYEMWFADPAVIEWTKTVAAKDFTVEAKKYPKGRRIAVCGGVVLVDEANPYAHGHIPFVPVFVPPDGERFYPSGTAEQLMGVQIMRNRAQQIAFEGMEKAVGQVTVYNPNLLHSKITNAPVANWAVDDIHAAVKFDRPPVLPRHLYDNTQQYDRDAQDIALSHDISQGRMTPGNKTAAEINQAYESDQTFIQMAGRELTSGIRDVGRMLFSNMVQFSDWSTFVRVAGEVPGFPDVREVRREVKGKELMKDEAAYDLSVDDTASLPSAHQARTQDIQAWAQMGVQLPPDVTLEYAGAPRWIVDKVRQALSAPPPAPEGPPMEGVPPEMGMGAPPPEMAPPPEPMQDPVMAELQAVIDDMGIDPEAVATALESGIPPEEVIAQLTGGGMPSPM